MNVVPNVLNLRSTNGLVTAVINVSEGETLQRWTVSNLRLAGVTPVSFGLSADGRSLVAAFPKSALASLPSGDALVTVTGNLSQGGLQGDFIASTTVRVIR